MSDEDAPTSEEPEGAGPEKKSGGAGCLIAVVGGVLLVVLLSMFGSGGDDEDDGPTSAGAIDVCEQHVRDLLRAPSTADFGGQQASLTSSGHFTVTGWVDAENGFGAKLRSDWSCSATHVSGANWRTNASLSD